MKSLLVCLFLLPQLLSAAAAMADGPEGQETLLKMGPAFPAQGGPGIRIANVNGRTAMLLGGRGVMLVSENLGIGVSSYTLSSEITTDLNSVKRDLSFSYFGLTVDNFFLPKKLFYVDVSTMVGYGFATGSRRDLAGTKDQTSFFLVEPEVNLMLNVTRELRLGFGISYRLMAGSDINSVVGTGLSGAAGSFTLMYGK